MKIGNLMHSHFFFFLKLDFTKKEMKTKNISRYTTLSTTKKQFNTL